MAKWCCRALAAVIGLGLLVLVPAQSQSTIQKMVITVTNPAGEYVPGLRAQDFTITENGERKGIARFLPDSETPLSLGVLIDTSGSMGTRDFQGRETLWASAVGATRALLHMLKPQDEFMLMTFDSGLNVVQNFTSGHNKVESHLREIRPVGMGTDLFGSVAKAIVEVKKSKNKRRGLVVITDAEDNGGFSVVTLSERIHMLEIPVFTFALRPGMGGGAGFGGGGGFGGRGGFGGGFGGGGFGGGRGTSVTAALDALDGDDRRRALVLDISRMRVEDAPTRIVQFVQNVAIELRGQYTLGYYSEDTGPVWRRVIRVRTLTPSETVHIRRETLAGDDPAK